MSVLLLCLGQNCFRFQIFLHQAKKDQSKILIPKAATETIFSNICSFFPGVTFILFFQEALSVYQTHTNFPGGNISSSNTCCFWRTMLFFQRPYAIEQIGIFLGKYLSSNRHFSNRSRWLLS